MIKNSKIYNLFLSVLINRFKLYEKEYYHHKR